MINNEASIGKYLFDSLTLGMYDNPLCIFREYIQNSADSIDKAVSEKLLDREKAEIFINIDPQKKNIVIEDNGFGIIKNDVAKTLLSIGNSSKIGFRERGFRGIGRLGGMAYCDEIEFQTKSKGDDTVSVNKWNCIKITEMLNPQNLHYKDATLVDVVKECATIEHNKADKKNNGGYFRVELKNVNCTNNVLLDIAEVKKYISKVAPVPFNYQVFPFGKEIDDKLRKEIPNYNIFKVVVNFEEIFKPYKTSIQLSKGMDKISNIIEYELLDDDGKIIAKGWRGERDNLNGYIPKGENIDGIRVRVGNILLGDEKLLDKAFVEQRFNSWFTGEVHTIDPRLIPNSRRDDFEDNQIREVLYNSIEKTLGTPLSSLIRDKSNERSKLKPVVKAEEQLLNVKSTLKKGFVGTAHKNETIKDLRNTKNDLEDLINKKNVKETIKKPAEDKIKKINETIKSIKENDSSISTALSSKYSKKEADIINKIFDIIYINYSKSDNPLKLVELIIKALNKLD